MVLLTVAVDLKRAQVMNQIPCVIGLHHIRERRHRSSIKTGHEDAIEILIAAATLEASVVAGVREVVRTNGLVFAVGQGCGRGTISASLLTMALPAFHLLEKFSSVGHALGSNRRLGGNLDRISRLLALPAR